MEHWTIELNGERIHIHQAGDNGYCSRLLNEDEFIAIAKQLYGKGIARLNGVPFSYGIKDQDSDRPTAA